MKRRTRIDDLDARIITLLRNDGRRSNVDIARYLKVAEGTVRKRIERLVRERVIQIGAWADPLKIGYQTYANIELSVNLRDIEAVAERVAKLPEIFFLGIRTDRSDIFATACFRSNEHFHEFITKRLARVPGIRHASSSSINKIVKREHTFPVAMHGDNGPAAAWGERDPTGKRRRPTKATRQDGNTTRD
jgi:Lrp/AsnC family transcriptional regulator for asnA, asnC and gidA